jgi:hypothetical protein
MYNEHSVGIGPTYFWLACLNCQLSYFQSSAVISKTAKILGKDQVAASSSRRKNKPHLSNIKRRPGFEPGSGHVGFVVDKVVLGQVFSEYFGFPCQSSVHQLLHNRTHLSSGACTIGQKWPQYLVDLVPPH